MQMSVFKTSCLQYRISRSRGAEELYKKKTTPKTFTGKTTQPRGFCDTGNRTVSREPEDWESIRRKRSPCHVKTDGRSLPGRRAGYQNRIAGSPLLICFCLSKPLLQALEPVKIGKALALKWCRVSPIHKLKNFDRAHKFWLRPMWFLAKPDQGVNYCRMWRTQNRFNPDYYNSLQMLFYWNQRPFYFLCWGKTSRSVRCCSRVNSASDKL